MVSFLSPITWKARYCYTFLILIHSISCRITRRLPKGSRVCTMSSLFYTKLGEKDGVEKAASWVKNVDFFGMDMIFVPVTMGLHHTISVIVNPGSIANAYKRTGERLESDSRPAILFMDALDAHDFVSISRNLNNFLNHLWVKGGRSNVAGSARPFTRTANPVIIPFGTANQALVVCRSNV